MAGEAGKGNDITKNRGKNWYKNWDNIFKNEKKTKNEKNDNENNNIYNDNIDNNNVINKIN